MGNAAKFGKNGKSRRQERIKHLRGATAGD
jgi:hypothetical protein